MEITRIKQSCFFIKWNGINICIDPFGVPKIVEKADLILITHPHFDHTSKKSISRLIKDDTRLICPTSTTKIINQWSSKVKITTMEPGDDTTSKGFSIKAVPLYNVDKLIKFHYPKQKWCGYIISEKKVSIYHAGDTDFIPEMKELKNLDLNLAFLPVGGTFTMDPKQAIEATNSISPHIMIPMHERGKNMELFKDLFENKVSNSELVYLAPGEKCEFDF